MFTSGIKGNQRCNGFNNTSHDQIYTNKSVVHVKLNSKNNSLNNRDTYNNGKHSRNRKSIEHSITNTTTLIQHDSASLDVVKVKLEPDELDFESNITANSIIGLGDMNIKSETHIMSAAEVKAKLKKDMIRATHHEVLQRIEVEPDNHNHYQQHWFSASLEKFKLEDRSREERIEITRHEFRRHIKQLIRSNVGIPSRHNSSIEERALSKKLAPIVPEKSKYHKGYSKLVEPTFCEAERCSRPALPCTKHCPMHIMLNTEQVLFEYCTAKFADNTHCSTPVFDVAHELPLCAEHARKRDNYKLYQEAKPKKLRKKVKPSAMIRPQKRSKKRRKPPSCNSNNRVPQDLNNLTTRAIVNSPPRRSPSEDVSDIIEAESSELEDMQMVDQVLGLNENGLEQALATQAQLLEETDISTVLSTIQVDEFSDLFAVNRNGEYEPSREEAEELEKALAAVDNDVKSLEKLTRTHGLLDPFLADEHCVLADTTTLIQQIPDVVFHHHGNGYSNQATTATPASFLLPVVEPHSQT